MKKIYPIFILLVAFLFATQCTDTVYEKCDLPNPPKEKVNYDPADPEGIGGKYQIPVAKGKASEAQALCEIELSFDDDLETMYHSPWDGGGTTFPVTLEYMFEKGEKVDYIQYEQRPKGDNGGFGKFELWVQLEGKSDYEKVGDYDFEESQASRSLILDKPIEKATAFKFIVHSGLRNYVSCAEMKFIRNEDNNLDGLEDIFTSLLCTELHSNVGQAEIDAMTNKFFQNIAQSMFDKTYPREFRIQKYEPYRTLNSLTKELKTSSYNSFENPTGMYFNPNTEVVVLVGDTQGEEISLRVHDFDRNTGSQYLLSPGINKVKITTAGLGYINYYTDNYKTKQPIEIHIPNGRVNGYFDKNKHKKEDWARLLGNSIAYSFDVKGDYVNLAYRATDLMRHTPDGLALINLYDAMIYKQYEIMGLVKYDRVPKNHMFGRTVKSGLFADGTGAGFGEDFMDVLAGVEKAKEGAWLIAHEFGHVNQVRPGLRWHGTAEVTNNIYSVLTRYQYTPNYMALEHERINDGDNNMVIGGRFNSFLNYGVVKGEPWMFQKGQDKMQGYEDNGGDHFVKLAPLWQLLLYYKVAEGTSWHKPEWYADVAEVVRTTNESNMSNGQLQANFMKNTMDAVGEDLTEFFDKVGMLRVINKNFDDYGVQRVQITQQMVDDVKKHGGKYKKPVSPVIYYLSANSLKAYEKQQAVSGTFGKGVNYNTSNKRCIIDHGVWKNVAVFETYTNDKLDYVALVGTDSPDMSSTLVRYPDRSTRIEAVAWDGTRTLVYGKR